MPIAAVIFILFNLILITWGIWYYRKYMNRVESSQIQLSDKNLLLLFDEEPDGMMTPKRLAEKSKLNLKEAKSRLAHLNYEGLLSNDLSSSMKTFYSLKETIEHKPPPKLSEKPFLTVEDILILFKHHDFRLTLQNICISTGLPLVIIKREMKYFLKEKMIRKIHPQPNSRLKNITFVLREPYRSNPDQFLDLEDHINLDLEKIYQKELRK